MTKRRRDNVYAPFRTVTMTTLRASLEDCVALIRGDISGAAQREAILKEAERQIGARGEKEPE